MSKTVIALFDQLGSAEDAAELLRARGLVPERLHVLPGEEFVKRGQLPPPEHERALWNGVQSFFDEIGFTPPGPESASQAIEPNDGVVLLEANDESAEVAAAVLEEQEYIVDLDARVAQKSDPDTQTIASALEPDTSGRTPPDLYHAERSGETAGRARRRVRIYDTTAPRTASD